MTVVRTALQPKPACLVGSLVSHLGLPQVGSVDSSGPLSEVSFSPLLICVSFSKYDHEKSDAPAIGSLVSKFVTSALTSFKFFPLYF